MQTLLQPREAKANVLFYALVLSRYNVPHLAIVKYNNLALECRASVVKVNTKTKSIFNKPKSF